MNQTDNEIPARGLTAVDPLRHVFEEALGMAPSRNRMEGRAILVVGAGQRPLEGEERPPLGNGRAISLICAREGASVACADVNVRAVEETIELVKKTGSRAMQVLVDVSDPDAIERAVKEAADGLGHLDGMVLNVGIGGPSGLANQTADAWDAALAVNLRSHMLACKYALPLMKPGSSIVFVSSTASMRPGTRIPSYDASKAALAALCRHVALEGENLGIRANVIAPGPIDTPLGREASRARPARSAQRLPFGREGTAWEVAYTTLFLLSHESSFINAQVIVADGGITGLQLR
ncbi:SDR family NAD(P)-dependent oxidoreductase [Noviherbaspirillum sp. Root189]|uniref:SDR family NAD(P)-dependent oxidoreductase n=1 Tax=Noviherbaspirillum sp. Root189 TaxID=1736487 RepID=UPI0009E7D728|nr:SDR family oxidoreductase [Noviherbaspirillum sp. Root189]